jgi:hypothetical protein
VSIPRSDNQHTHQPITADDLHRIFSRFSPQDVEGFYQLYQLWQLQQKRTAIQQQLQELEELLSTKESSLLEVTPSAIAQAALSQFRASGIDDIDILERMLARGDHWLDHIWQLFERCQRLGIIQGNALEWCEHALEDAYEWLESISCPNNRPHNSLPEPLYPSHQPLLDAEVLLPTTTEEDFLHKLMSDGECEIHTNSHSNIQSEPSTASDTIDEQEATPPTSPQETLNLRPDNDQDAFSAAEEQPQPEFLEETLPPSLEDHTRNSSPEDLPLQPEHPEKTMFTVPTYVFLPSSEQIKKKPRQHTHKPKRGFFLQLLMKILGWQ